MDAWSGGEPSLIYDGAGSPDVMEFRLTTRDLGLHSQIVETGRQYRFQVKQPITVTPMTPHDLVLVNSAKFKS